MSLMRNAVRHLLWPFNTLPPFYLLLTVYKHDKYMYIVHEFHWPGHCIHHAPRNNHNWLTPIYMYLAIKIILNIVVSQIIITIHNEMCLIKINPGKRWTSWIITHWVPISNLQLCKYEVSMTKSYDEIYEVILYKSTAFKKTFSEHEIYPSIYRHYRLSIEIHGISRLTLSIGLRTWRSEKSRGFPYHLLTRGFTHICACTFQCKEWAFCMAIALSFSSTKQLASTDGYEVSGKFFKFY